MLKLAVNRRKLDFTTIYKAYRVVSVAFATVHSMNNDYVDIIKHPCFLFATVEATRRIRKEVPPDGFYGKYGYRLMHAFD